jgi:hypothetical protein
LGKILQMSLALNLPQPDLEGLKSQKGVHETLVDTNIESIRSSLFSHG